MFYRRVALSAVDTEIKILLLKFLAVLTKKSLLANNHVIFSKSAIRLAASAGQSRRQFTQTIYVPSAGSLRAILISNYLI